MQNVENVMVSVIVCTYNQEQWIRQTLDSILAQQTNYPYEVIIGEDHGTDGTRAICQEYANKYDNVTLLPLTENLGVTANWIHCIQAGTGKYIMGCAGDDYWHNPYKLQLQVEYKKNVYVVSNSDDKLKKIAKKKTTSNNEHGVEKVLKRI